VLSESDLLVPQLAEILYYSRNVEIHTSNDQAVNGIDFGPINVLVNFESCPIAQNRDVARNLAKVCDLSQGCFCF